MRRFQLQTTTNRRMGRLLGRWRFLGLAGRIRCILNLSCLLIASSARADTHTWDGGGTSGNWRDRFNWQGDTAPVAGDALVFPNGAARLKTTNDFTAGTRFGEIRFSGTNYEAHGNAILLDGDLRVDTAAINLEFYPDLTLNASLSFLVYADGFTTLYGDIDLNGHDLTVLSEMRLTHARGISGIGNLVKTGKGVFNLSGAPNTFTGTTTVNQGSLELRKGTYPGSAIAVPGPLVIGDGIGGLEADQVRLYNWRQIADTAPVTVNASGLLDLINSDDGIGSLSLQGGHVTSLDGLLELPPTNIVCLASVQPALISGRVDVTGSGMRIFDVANGAANPDLILSARITSGYGVGGLKKTGAGTMTLSGNNAFAGDVIVEQGSLSLEHAMALGGYGWGSSNVVTGTGQLIVKAVDVDAGSDPLYLENTNALVAVGPASWSGTVRLNTDSTVQVGSGTFELDGVIMGSGDLTKTGLGTLRLSPTTTNWFSGTTRVTAGTLELGAGSGRAVNGPLIIGDGLGGSEADVVRYLGDRQAIPSRVTVNSSGLLDLNGFAETNQLGLILNGGHVETGSGELWLGGAVTNNAADGRGIIAGTLGLNGVRTFGVSSSTFSPDLRIDACVVGVGGIIKVGAGELSLTASNAYTGVTLVNEGTLEVDQSHALGSTGAGTSVNGGILAVRYNSHVGSESLTLNTGGRTALRGVGGSNSWAGPITLTTDAGMDANGDTDFLNLSGAIGGTGGFVKTGEGTLILSGASDNTYTGDTTVNQGVLALQKTAGADAIGHGTLTIGDGFGGERADVVRLGADNQIALIPVVINASGLLDLNRHSDQVGRLTLDGGAIVTGSDGLLTLGGTLTAVPNPSLDPTIAGRLSLGSVVARSIDVEADAGETESLVISAAIQGTPNLAKGGGGALTLTSSNAYEGMTLVQEGALVALHTFALGDTNSGTVVSNGAVLLMGTGLRVTNESLTLNGPGFGVYEAAWCALGATSVWAGPVELASDTVVRVDPGDALLNAYGRLSGLGGLTKTGLGALRLSGGTSNSFVGTTRVHAGVLDLTKTFSDGAIAGPLVIGDDSGGTDADVVRIGVGALEQIADTAPVTVTGSGLFDVRSGGERIGALSGSGHVHLEGAIFQVNYDNASSVFSGLITGTGSPRKMGTGTLTLTGTNTHTGTTVASNGRLQVDGSQPASPLQVSAAGTLCGTGVVGRLTVSGGRVAPGASTGILTCSNVTFSATSTFEVELNGTSAGTGYDRLNVRGTNDLGGANLDVRLGFAPQEGDSFRILNNDGTDAMGGTFAGLTNGARFTANGVPFQINYAGGTGNDVVLTVTNTALWPAGAVAVQGGNGNGILEPNECNTLSIVLTNRATGSVSDITAVLTTTTPGVFVSQPSSTYPGLKPGASGTNETPFQLATTPAFLCGANIDLVLTVTTAAHGTFSIPLVLPTGTAGSPVVFDSKTVTAIPDAGTIESVLNVSNLTTALIDVVISCHITHPSDQDLDLTLIAPDGTEVVLSSDNGGSGDNYGSSCLSQNRTVFDDASHLAITTGTAPFVGRYQPEGQLAALHGKSGPEINGPWRLRITDDQAGNTGTLQCWSLSLTPATCADGGGPCELCPNQTISGILGESSQVQNQRLVRDGTASSCRAPKLCPGLSGTGTRSYDAYTFFNSGSSACITVSLRSESDLFSAAYLESYDPTTLCAHYLADRGTSTQVEPLGDYSFNVPGGATFVVVVNQVNLDDSGPYTLTVNGGDCQPVLRIRQDGARQVVLDWTTAAAGYQLEATATLSPRNFQPVLPLPVVVRGKNTVTNDARGASRFYRLHKP